ncbi:MAG: glycosyltransferase family 2 protein [Phycisphaerae bacterium]|nr:glycosyltransferase [Phycisphaerae bacterium]MCZ2400213.1 glycosyltransferase family 2 protein [Phycisphaerae bacterium]
MTLAALLYAAQWLVIAAWLACHVQINQARRRACRAVANSPDPDTPPPSVTVVIPAKDEEPNIGPCAAAVLAQQGVDLRLVIVNDRSADRTGEIAEALAAREARVRAIQNAELPAGWLGKSHACWIGAQRAASDWLLFVDADVRLTPTAVRSAIEHAQRHGLDVFSIWPRDASAGFWERLLVPLCGAMIVIWYGQVATRARPGRPAFANGQFLLVRRAAYDAIRGHAAVRDALIEDIPLATIAAGAGLGVGSALGSDLAAVRMYRGLAQVWRGWRRIYVGVLAPGQMAGCVLWLLVGSLAPFIVLPVALHAWLSNPSSPWPWLWTAGSAAHLVALLSVSVRFFGLARCRRAYLLLYPLSVIGVLLILADALLARSRRLPVTWRGTSYSLSARATVRALPAAREAS